MFSLKSKITTMGNRAHTIETDEREFAHRLFEKALNLDIEPDFAALVGGYEIGFVSSDAEALEAINEARDVAPKWEVTPGQYGAIATSPNRETFCVTTDAMPWGRVWRCATNNAFLRHYCESNRLEESGDCAPIHAVRRFLGHA